MAKLSAIDATSLTFQEAAAPSTPASTKWKLYAKTTGLFVKDDAGNEIGPFGAASGVFNQDTMLPWHVSIIPMVTTPDALTGTWPLAQQTSSGLLFPFYTPGSTANSGGATCVQQTTPAINNAIAYDVILAAGTWDAHFWVRASTNCGIITLQQDGSDMGTVDTYAAAPAASKVSISSWAVATTGKKRMNLKMATKNASSTDYQLTVSAIEFRRTA